MSASPSSELPAGELLVPRRPVPVSAELRVPGSKSIANRALVLAALADGESIIRNVPGGDDTTAMLDCLRVLGLDVRVGADDVTIVGANRAWSTRPHVLFAGLAGTTSRFLTAMAALASSPITIDGHPPLRSRPFGPLHDALVQLGVDVAADHPGGLPATVTGPPQRGRVEMRGDVSSQYITALMMIGPYLPGGLDLVVSTPLVSRPYVELTAATMARFGVDDVEVADAAVRVGPGTYAPTDLTVEPDASSASYPLGIAAICGGEVTISGLGADALQGDAQFADLLAAMGCDVDRTATSVRVRSSGRLSGLDVDLADVSDLVPTMAVIAAFAETPTRISGVGFIRAKESDRLGDLADELQRAGVRITATDDGLVIEPSTTHVHSARLRTHHDHRLAMAFGVLAARVEGIVVDDAAVVSKSWPSYWADLDAAFGRNS